MKTLTSRANPTYKSLLADAKLAARRGHHAWLDGAHLCQAWLATRGQPHMALFDLSRVQDNEVEAIAQATELQKQLWLSHELMRGLSSLTTPSPVIFVIDTPEQHHGVNPAVSYVLLDDIQDPGNVGTILRTAAAAGIQHVVTSEQTAACWAPKVLRAGQGAQFGLSIQENTDLEHWLHAYRALESRQPILATSLHQSSSLYAVALPLHTVWVFGHEGRGVAPALLALADQTLTIPHASGQVESLNVAVAAAICLFEQRRQHLSSGPSEGPSKNT
jgi:RNA methyltransferase, TrmH family